MDYMVTLQVVVPFNVNNHIQGALSVVHAGEGLARFPVGSVKPLYQYLGHVGRDVTVRLIGALQIKKNIFTLVRKHLQKMMMMVLLIDM